MRKIYLVILTMLLIVGCDNYSSQLQRIEEIEAVGDNDPQLALLMLDSIKPSTRKCSEYVQKKYDLLEIRLKDKAYVPMNSDIMVRELVEYFDDNGSSLDKQEAHYYAGSVYRDIDDAPRAIDHFLISRDIALNNAGCDSTMLRNTYSNLHYIYNNVQDYQNALLMAEKELECSKHFNDITATDYIHVGSALKALDRTKEAMGYFDKAYALVTTNNIFTKDEVTTLLYHYTRMKNKERAQKCFELIDKGDGKRLTSDEALSLAEYLLLIDRPDSAEIFLRKVLYDETYPLSVKYDAAHRLLLVNIDISTRDTLAKYAAEFIEVSDSLNLGTRQIAAATVNNKYKYNRDAEAEEEMKAKQEMYKRLAIGMVLGTFLVIAILLMMYFRSKYNTVRTLLSKDVELNNLKKAHIEMMDKIQGKEEELNSSRSLLDSKTEQLQQINAEIDRFKEEVNSKKEEMNRMQTELEEKVKQNELLLRSLHTFALAQDAEDVKNKIDLAIRGRYSLQDADWGSLYQAVDRQNPSFIQELAEKLGAFDEKQKQFCYLIKMGLSNGQIENILDVSHATIWRWSNKYRDLLGLR